MEEQKPRIQPPPPFYHPLARQPYLENEYGVAPLEEDGNVVPMPIQNTIAEDERRPRNASKRKPQGVTEAKKRAAANSKKTFKTVRQSQSTLQHQYADELQRLEAHAKRINQILAEQSNQEPIREQIAQRSPPIQPIKNQWHSPPPIEEQPIETLTSQEQSIHQRLVELGFYLNEAGALMPFSEALVSSEKGSHANSQSPIPQPADPEPPISYSPTQTWESSLSNLWDQEPSHTAKTDTDKTEDYSNWDRETLNQDLPRDRPRSRPSLPTTLRRYFRSWRGRWRDGRSRESPRHLIDRISNAAVWIATFAIVRVASRYLLAAVPILSPIVLMLMLAPAIVAVYLAFCVPKAGWISYYRLFLTMVGFLVGSKL